MIKNVFCFKIWYLAALLVFANNAYCFKAGTHVWIAQQVIDDLRDGKVDIAINGSTKTFTVDPQIVAAILHNQSTYRMGHIGPDAAPDIYAGQMAIHPGTMSFGSDKWAMALNQYVNTPSLQYSDDDWYKWKDSVCEAKDYKLDEIWSYLDNISSSNSESTAGGYLEAADEIGLLDAIARAAADNSTPPLAGAKSVNPMQVAYEKGFLGHLSGDTFAHSYVNYYAGDVFSITNGEIETEKRHSAVEAYIDKKLPPLAAGELYNLIDSPSEFIANAFIFNPAIVAHFGSFKAVDGSIHNGLAPHLFAMHKYRMAIRNAAASCTWTAIDRFAMQIAVNAWTGYVPNEQQIKIVNQVQDQVHGLTSDFKQGIGKAHNTLNNAITSVHRAHFKVLNQHMNAVESGFDKVNKLEQAILDAEYKLTNEIVGKTCDYEKKITKTICLAHYPWGSCAKTLDEISFVSGPACVTDATYKAAVKVRDAAIAARNQQIGGLLHSIEEDLQALEEAIVALHDLSNAMSNTIVAIADFSSDISPFRKALRKWDTDVKAAIVAWVDANAQIIRNSIENSKQPPTSEDKNCFKVFSGIGNCFSSGDDNPIANWAQRYAPAFSGVPSEFSALSQASHNALSSLEKLASGHARNDLLNTTDPLTRMMVLELEKYISKELSSIDLVEKLLDFTNNEELMDVYNDLKTVFAVRMDNGMINELFSQDIANLGLIKYSKITDVMDRDMGLTPGSTSYLNPNNFPVLKNAITLSKLSLLSPDELNRVAAALGISSPTQKYGSTLYSGIRNIYVSTPGGTQTISIPAHPSYQNILYYAIRNIDGYEAWKPQASELPRLNNMFNLSFAMENNDAEYPPLTYGYAYSSSDKSQGFRFWQEGESYFNKLFDMPLFASQRVSGSANTTSPPATTTYCSSHAGARYGIVNASIMSTEVPKINAFCGSCGFTATPPANYQGGALPNLTITCKK